MSDSEAESYHFGDGSPQPTPLGDVNRNYSTFEKNNYVAMPPTFNGDSTKFEWWKSKMYTHIIGLDDELWDILEDEIDIPMNGVGMIIEKLSHLF